MFATLSFHYCAKSIPQKFQSKAQPKPSLKCLIMKLHVTKNERKRESEGGVSVTLHLNLPFLHFKWNLCPNDITASIVNEAA